MRLLILHLSKVRKAWSEQILEMDWGVAIRVRVYWRQSHEGEPTEEEMEEMCSDRNFYQSIKSNLTWEDISNAYATGQEVRKSPLAYLACFIVLQQLGVWCMKCVGYDTEFQRFLVENVGSYVPPSRKKKSNNREEGTARSLGKRQKARSVESKGSASTVKAGLKRKRDEDSEASGDEAQTSKALNEKDHEDDESEIEVDYTSKGTKSRPQKAGGRGLRV